MTDEPSTIGESVVEPEPQREQGEVLLELIESQPQWVHRRVERLVIDDTGECTRYASLDFTVRTECRIQGSSDHRVLVPLGVLKKGALRGFDVRGPSEKPLSLLGKRENSELALQLLIAGARRHQPTDEALQAFTEVARRVVEVSPTDKDNQVIIQEIHTAVNSVVTKVVYGVDVDASSDEEKIEELRSQLRSLVEKYIAGFLMVIELDDEVIGQRSLVKFAFREPVYTYRRDWTVWDVNDFAMAESTHFELSPPPLLEVSEALLIGFRADGRKFELDTHSNSDAHSTLHLVGSAAQEPAADSYLSARVIAKMTPRSFGAYSAAFWGPFALALTIMAGIVIRRLRADMTLPPEKLSAGLPTLMLAASGLLLTWVARTPEDWTTAQILRPARYVLWCAAGLCSATAAYLALSFGEPGRTYGWLFGLVLALTLLVVAWFVHGRQHKAVSGIGFVALMGASAWVAGYALKSDFSLLSELYRTVERVFVVAP